MGKNLFQILGLTCAMALFQSCGEMKSVSSKTNGSDNTESASTSIPENSDNGDTTSPGTPSNGNNQNPNLPTSSSDNDQGGQNNPQPSNPQNPLPQPQPQSLAFDLKRGDSFGFILDFNGMATINTPATLEIISITNSNQKELKHYFRDQLTLNSTYSLDLGNGESSVTFSLPIDTNIPLSERHIITASITSASNLFPSMITWNLEPKPDDILKISYHSPGPTVTATLSGDMYSAQTWDGRLVSTPKINFYANNIPTPIWTVERPVGSVEIMTESNINPAMWFQEKDPQTGLLSVSSKSQHFDGILSTSQNNNWGRLTDISTTYSSFLGFTEFSTQDAKVVYGRYNHATDNTFQLDRVALPRNDLVKVALSGNESINNDKFNFFGGIDSNGNAYRWFYELGSTSTGYWKINKFKTAHSPFTKKAIDVIGGRIYLAFLMDDDTLEIITSSTVPHSTVDPGVIDVKKANTKATKLRVINQTALYVIYEDGTARLFQIPVVGLKPGPQKLNLPCEMPSLLNTTNSYIECGDIDLKYNHLIANPYVQKSTGITWQPVYDAANNVFKKLPVQ